MSDSISIVSDDRSIPDDWDRRAVSVPGGNVMQSSTWAEYRRDHPEQHHFLTFDDGAVAFATLRSSRGLPGSEASVRRGPAHRNDAPAQVAARAAAIADWARSVGARDLFIDPEQDADADYAAAMATYGFATTDGREPSIHVMRRTFEPGLDDDALFASLSKSTRQRIRAGRDAGIRVQESKEQARMTAFAALLRERADVLGIALQRGDDYLAGWTALIHAGLARLLLAEHKGEIVGGLFLFRHGGIHSTAFSADQAGRRRDLPGIMHSVRWHAISDALAEGCPAIDLGGVDLPGHREPPQKGDMNRGLYEHKRGFGADWVVREPARRIILRGGAERLARARRAAIDALRGMRR